MHTGKTLLFFALCCTALLTHAAGFDYKQAKDFKPLSAYPDAAAFEKVYKAYVQECLNETYGGTAGIPCYVGYALWDRELNIYYKKLHTLLSSEERNKLRTAQVAWLNMRDRSKEISNMILIKAYPQPGTMYMLMRAGDASAMSTPMVKERALLLKQWYEAIKP